MAAVELTDSDFEEKVLSESLPVVVDFWAPWCGPCRAIEPIIEELAEKYEGKVKIYRFNVDESPVIPGRLGIRAIPTLFFFKEGKIYDQITGVVPKTTIEEVIKQIL